MRISTTTLESFRLWRDPEQDWMPEHDLIASIRGQFTGNHKVWLGSAFGAVMEDPDRHAIDGGYAATRGGERFVFSAEMMRPALALVDHASGVFEAKAIGRYGRHDVVAKADYLCGSDLREFKTTLGAFDFDKYAASCQWKFMADIFRPTSITYHVFVLAESPDGELGLKDIETFRLFPYEGMRDECADLVRDFEDYAAARGLVGLLDARQVAA